AMMIVLWWLIDCVLIALLLAGGAAAWERAASWTGRPARWGWLAALAGSVTLPFVLRLLPEPTWAEPLAAPMQLLRLDGVVLSAGDATTGLTPQSIALMRWAAASAIVLLYVAGVVIELRRARRSWRAADVDGGQVLITQATGPAAIGLRRSAVVVPAWALELDAELRSLLLRHERSHVEAGDPRLLFAGVLLLAAMPWNPVVWFELLRLRNAIELDCDARVLASGASPRRYGSLLLEVGRRRSAHALVMATFAEPRIFLEERIRRNSRWPSERNRARAAAFALAAVLLVIGAVSCDPVRVSNVPESVPTPPATIQESPPLAPMTKAPELTNREEVARALVAYYPPLVRDAGIGGTATVNMFIDTEGTVQRVMLGRSSGYPSRDEAALAVAGRMKWTPALLHDGTVAVWVEIPIEFNADNPADGAPSPSRARVLREERRERSDQPAESRPRTSSESQARFT